MTRISSLFLASTLAILPIGAFAQTNPAPAKDAAPSSMTSTTSAGVPSTTPAPVAGKTAEPTKAAVTTKGSGAKSEVHGMNTVNPHHAKTAEPAKTADPSKS